MKHEKKFGKKLFHSKNTIGTYAISLMKKFKKWGKEKNCEKRKIFPPKIRFATSLGEECLNY